MTTKPAIGKWWSPAPAEVSSLREEQRHEGVRREFISDPDETTEFDDGVAVYRGVPVEVTDPWPIESLIRRIDTETFEDVAQEVYDEAFNLLVERQKKYGPKNVEQQGLYGLLVRMRDDKLNRIQRALNGRVVQGEILLDEINLSGEEGDTLEDAYLDLANYAVISLILLRGKWGKPLAKDVGFDQ